MTESITKAGLLSLCPLNRKIKYPLTIFITLSSLPYASKSSPVCSIGMISSYTPTMKKAGMKILGAAFFKGFNLYMLNFAFSFIVEEMILKAAERTKPGIFVVLAAMS